jgi:hypothetical protein
LNGNAEPAQRYAAALAAYPRSRAPRLYFIRGWKAERGDADAKAALTGHEAEAKGAAAAREQARTVPPIAPALLAAATGDLDAVAPEDADKARQIIALRAAAPKRSEAGKAVEPQQDAAHLPLFIAANEPRLF